MPKEEHGDSNEGYREAVLPQVYCNLFRKEEKWLVAYRAHVTKLLPAESFLR